MKKGILIGIIVITVVIFLFYSFGGGEGKNSEDEMVSGKRTVNLKAEDDINLKGGFYPRESNKAVILLHMLNGGREDYDEFALMLNEEFGVLSIDSRGHGESELDWTDFLENDFNGMVLDVKVAKEFLVEKGFSEIYLVGASIGANTALNYAAGDSTIKKIVLLSPGLDYRGVSTEESIKNYAGKLLIVASEEDGYSFSSSEKLFENSTGEKDFIRLNNVGHGTNMFEGTNLMGEIVDWLR